MRRALLFSFLVSLLSIVIVLYSPLKVPVRESDKVYSPYREEIDQLSEKTKRGLHPSAPEWEKIKELRKLNNQWFEEQRKEYLKFSAKDALDSWKKKSSLLAPGIMVLWGVLFYFFYRRKPSNYAPLVLVFPVILTIAQLMSLLEFVLIAFAVLAVWFWFLLNPPNSSPSESVSI